MHDDSAGGSIRWGIIGCGDVTEKKSGPALYTTDGSQLVAVMRRDLARAEDYARRHGAKRWYSDAAALVADPEVNAVYIASPHDRHLEHVRLAAQAGKSVLCEKPVGASLAESQAILDLCRARGVSLTVAYYRRFWPVVQALRRLLAEGAIGEILAARVLLLDHFAGDPARPWLISRAAAGGGALANAGSHWIDLLRYLLGDVVDVWASCSSAGLGFEVDDTSEVHLLAATGATATLLSSWRSRLSVNELEISGSEGRLLAAPLSEGRLVLQRRGREPVEQQYPRQAPAHGELIAALVPCLLAGEASPLPGDEALATWQIMDAAYRSSAEGRRVRLR